MNKYGFIFAAACVFAGVVFGSEWVNVIPESRVGGRMASCGYLKGKVVLLDVRDYSNAAEAKKMLQIQDIWTAYKSKRFVALGSHVGSADTKANAERLVKKLHLTYSVYSKVGIKDNGGMDGVASCGVYVFDPTGRQLYYGKDPRQAMGVVGSAIFAANIPSTPKYWRSLIDYEISNLPGQAFLRIRDMKLNHKDVLKKLSEQYPEDVKRYAEIWREYNKDGDIKKLAKLVETARLIKDRDKSSRASQRISASALEDIIKKYSILTKSENPLIVQEAKNSIAELKFVQAELAR